MPEFKTPVLLLLFNRPQHTAAVLDRLRSIRPVQVFVHCDGPRTDRPGEREKVEAVRREVEKIDWPCTVQTLYRDENSGLRNGVSQALDWFFSTVEQGIVLEDDCLPDPSFFPFCAELLEKYAAEPRVLHIGGSNVAESRTKAMPDSYFFSSFAFVWGWASWRRAWQHMSLQLEGLDEFEQSVGVGNISSDRMAQVYLLDKFQATRAGKNNSWAYAWFYSIVRSGGLCVVPGKNLVQNTGIGDASATHTTGANPTAGLRAVGMAFPLKHPARIERQPELDREIFYFAQKSRVRLILWFLLKKIGLR
ncbi:MAG: hypothetical protein SFV22_14475 [Saprospiraceae bacterium]|nr:hypothetical protein [Saprospiraceae bacterium]